LQKRELANSLLVGVFVPIEKEFGMSVSNNRIRKPKMLVCLDRGIALLDGLKSGSNSQPIESIIRSFKVFRNNPRREVQDHIRLLLAIEEECRKLDESCPGSVALLVTRWLLQTTMFPGHTAATTSFVLDP